MKHNGTRLMKILIFYSLTMSFSCATCMSTLGFCIIIFLFSGSLPSATLYYKSCTKHFPVLLCTTKLAQSTSQYYFVLQSLHKLLPSTTLYYKACTKHFPVLLCTTKLAQSPSQYYFVLQSLHKALLPLLLCTTKLAQTTSQYYFVLQSLHKALPSTTLYYKACTKSFPVLLCTTKLAQSTSCLETFEKARFCSFPHRHGIHHVTTTRRRPDDDTMPTRRRRDEPLEANKGPAPRPPDYKREPFATHSGKTG